ncbi:hypothetical protein P9112_003920 [Eukaryota sp. TZLM1-RC]
MSEQPPTTNAPGEASIKPEFLLTEQVDNEAGSKRTSSSTTSDSEPKKRGAFAKRNKKNLLYIKSFDKLCTAVVNNQPCPRENCKFSHDVDGFLAKKPSTLDLPCPFSPSHPDANPNPNPNNSCCSFGITCLGKDHVTPSNPPEKPFQTVHYDNHIEVETKFKLQKNKYFNKDELIPIYTERSKIHVNSSQSTSWLAPLATLGHAPFRKICLDFDSDLFTCSEMVSSWSLMQGNASELGLLRKHADEKRFGVQLVAGNPLLAKKSACFLEENVEFDWMSLNCACPIDVVTKRGMGSALMRNKSKIKGLVQGIRSVSNKFLSIKIRQGISDPTVHNWVGDVIDWGVDSIMMHGRTAQQRYSKKADYEYLANINNILNRDQSNAALLVANGDIYLPKHLEQLNNLGISHYAVGRGALMKPWIFEELKTGQIIDKTSSERFDLLRKFCNLGLSFWGSDIQGVETTRRYLLEWLSFYTRYVPVGILQEVHELNLRAPPFKGRNDMESLLASSRVSDWISISEMLLGKVPENFTFVPKHRSKV